MKVDRIGDYEIISGIDQNNIGFIYERLGDVEEIKYFSNLDDYNRFLDKC